MQSAIGYKNISDFDKSDKWDDRRVDNSSIYLVHS
jgi:hypothetical protein